MTPEEKALATVQKSIKTLEGRVNEYNEFIEKMKTQGRDYIAKKVVEDIKGYEVAGYYADATDKFLTVLEAHKVPPTPELVKELIPKLLECASYSKWMAERQAGEIAKEDIKRR